MEVRKIGSTHVHERRHGKNYRNDSWLWRRLAADPTGWFVVVKSAEPRFPDNPLWGDRWGWAYFDVEDKTTAVTEDYDAECKACHVPAEVTDWVYVRGYPVLNDR